MKKPLANPHEAGRLGRLGMDIRKISAPAALAAFGVLTVAVVIVATIAILVNLRARELKRVEREVDNLSHILAEQTTRAVQGVDLVLRDAADRLKQGQASGFLMDDQSIHTLLRARISGVPQVRSLLVTGRDGTIAHSTRDSPSPPLSASDRQYFLVHRDNPNLGTYIDKVTLSRYDGAPVIQVSRRRDGPAGEFEGVITATLDSNYFAQLYDTLRLGEGTEVLLFRRDGTLLVRHPALPEQVGKSFAGSAMFRALDARDSLGPASGVLRTDEGGARLVAYHETDYYPLVVAVSRPEQAALASWRHQALLMGSGAVGVLLLLALAAAALGRELKREERLTAALGDSEARLAGIIASAMDAVITVDQEQRIVLFNPAAEKMFRCRAADALGSPLGRFVPERFRTAHQGMVEQFGHTGVSSRTMGGRVEVLGLRSDGEEFPIDVSISQVAMGGERYYTAIVRDVSQRRQAETDLRKSHEQLRQLSASLQSVREEERTRIARELHDELGQRLTGLKMDLAWMAPRLHEDQTALAHKIDTMKALVDATVASMRRIASELRPLVLDDLGLAAAVDWLVEDFSRRTGIQVDTDLQGAEGLDERLAICVFRIIQESLTNVARHAQATQVGIALAVRDGQLALEVRDNGKGLAEGAGDKKTFGLIGMRERAYMFGGQMTIDSRPAEGTAIRVTIPLEQPAPRPSGDGEPFCDVSNPGRRKGDKISGLL